MASATIKVEMNLSPGELLLETGDGLLTEASEGISIERWTDITADVRTDSKIHVRYGIFGTGVRDRVADIGEMTFALDNSIGNSGAALGYYSPDHASVRTDFVADQEVRLLFTYSGTTYYKFHGWLRDINPEAGQKGTRRVHCRVEDWMGTAARTKLERIATQTSKRGDQLLTTVVAAMNRPPMSTSYATGQSTYDYAFDSTRDETTTVMRECQKIAQSGLEYIYVNGDTSTGGVLTFEDRHARPKISSASSDLDDVMHGLDAGQSVAVTYNKVRVTVHPRTIDAAATTVLYSLVNEIQLAPGETKAHVGQYRDADQRAIRVGGTEMVTPVSSTDYLMNDTSGGGGTDTTSDLTITATYGGNSVEYSLENTGSSTGYITKLQARGKGIYDYQPSILDASDDAGDNILDLDMPYQDDELTGQDAANYLYETRDVARTLIPMVRFYGNRSDTLMTDGLAREIGSRVTLTETATGIDSDWFINGIQITVTSAASGGNSVEFGWCVMPQADFGLYWLLGDTGASELGDTTYLGF